MATRAQMLEELEKNTEPLEKASGFIKYLLYGDNGVGKTVGAMKLAQALTPPDKEIIYVDSHEGWVSLLNHPELLRRVRRIRWRGIPQQQLLNSAVKKREGSYSNVGCMIFDEVTSMANADLDVVLKARTSDAEGMDKDVVTQPMMGINTERMRRVLWDTLELPVHLIFVGHRRIDEDDAKVRVISPDFMPKLSKRFREPMHVVAHAFSVEKLAANGDVEADFLLQVHPTRKVVAKTRVGGFRKVNTTWDNLIKNTDTWLNSNGVLANEQVEKPEITDSVQDTDEGIVVE